MNERRQFLRLSGIALAGGLAGCTSERSTDTEASGDDPTSTTTPSPAASSGEAPPGADRLGGPDDLQSSATVEALSLEGDRGAGQFVFSPAVVWVEPGATVEWTIESGAHSATAYHPDNDKSLRIPEDASPFDSGVLESGASFEHTFETEGVHDYYCTPHEGLGMVGLAVVGGVGDGPGTADPSGVESGAAADSLTRLFEVAGIGAGSGDGDGESPAYGWQAATWDSYWYSLYNMSTNIAMSGNGVTFPATEQQKEVFEQRFPKMLEAAGQDEPPVKNPNLNMAPFTAGDPGFTEQPVLSGDDGRPDAGTLSWDPSASSKVVSPASVAWTHLKGVTWAKNFQNHFDILPDSLAAEFRSEVLATLAQLGVKFSLVDGNLRANEKNLLLVSGWRPGEGVVAEGPDLRQHTAMLWFLGDLVSLAQGGWFGYENPEPLIPAENLQTLADGLARTVTNAFAPSKLGGASTRDLGALLGGVGWYGTHAGSDQLASMAADYANNVADLIADQADGNGRVAGGADNQAATQGAVGQGLLWASELDGVDRADLAGDALGYLLETLWDGDAGTFASGADADTYRFTARDAGDVTGGVNAADAVLGTDDAKPRYARFFDNAFNRGRLQRAERPQSRDEDAEHTLPLPPTAGGEFGQAAVYNAAVEYDAGADEWAVVDDRFDTEAALYLANQDIWISQWGGEFFDGRGVPGTNDEPK